MRHVGSEFPAQAFGGLPVRLVNDEKHRAVYAAVSFARAGNQLIIAAVPLAVHFRRLTRHGLLNELEENALKARVVIYNPTTTTKKVQEAYRQLQSFKKYVPIVFPKKSVITGGEIAFVGQAKELFDTQSYSSTLEDIMKLQLFTDKRQADLLETMEVFLLDGNMSVAKTAELMFTHKNTIQYRIKSLEGILGHKLTRIPEVYNLYTLAAINRLNKAI